jgi:hypothetical protein
MPDWFLIWTDSCGVPISLHGPYTEAVAKLQLVIKLREGCDFQKAMFPSQADLDDVDMFMQYEYDDGGGLYIIQVDKNAED